MLFPLFQLFPKLWLDIYNTDKIDRKFVLMLLSSHGFIEYIDAVLLDERSSLNNFYIFNFLKTFFPKICDQVLTDQVQNIITQLVHDFVERSTNFHLTRASQIRMLNGDLRALLLVNTAKPEHLSETLLRALLTLKVRIQETMEEIARVERGN